MGNYRDAWHGLTTETERTYPKQVIFIFYFTCRMTLKRRFYIFGRMPSPLSIIRSTRARPPPTSISMMVLLASIAFSTSLSQLRLGVPPLLQLLFYSKMPRRAVRFSHFFASLQFYFSFLCNLYSMFIASIGVISRISSDLISSSTFFSLADELVFSLGTSSPKKESCDASFTTVPSFSSDPLGTSISTTTADCEGVCVTCSLSLSSCAKMAAARSINCFGRLARR